MRVIATLFAFFVFGCSALTDPNERVRCVGPSVELNEGDPCGPMLSCIDSLCQACPNAAETCNGVDDDCDKNVDEFPDAVELCNGVDDDCDSFIDEGLDTLLESCDDRDNDCDGEIDEDVRTFDEQCDEFDNDCDGRVDEETGDIPETCNGRDDDCDGRIDENGIDRAEACNEIDDDCDGMIDEGLSGVSDTCGDRFDNDCDGTVDEGMPEVCDNVDNDCNGEIDEGNLCPGAQLCNGGTCEDPSCTNGAVECADNQACNPDTGECEINDSRCDDDDDCTDGRRCSIQLGRVCVPRSARGESCSEHFNCDEGSICDGFADAKWCTSACCSADDCGSGETCSLDPSRPESDHRICRPNAGLAAEGGDCESNADCRSGLCLIVNSRGDMECSSSPCARDSACGSELCTGLPSDGWVAVTLCDSASADGEEPGAPCTRFSECDNFLCDAVGGPTGQCLERCGSDADCASTEACQSWFYGDGGRYGSVCRPRETSNRRGGEACSRGESCASGRCTTGNCDRLCCNTADCPGSQECVPTPAGTGRFINYCETVSR